MKILVSVYFISVVLLSSFAKNVVKRDYEDQLKQFTEDVDQDSVLRCYQSSSQCGVKYTKVGCYQDNMSARTLEVLLFQDRDMHGAKFSGTKIDWNNWEDYMQDLACRCATQAQAKGYVHFGLQYYGECFGGHESSRRYDHYGKSTSCTGQNYQDCQDESVTECVGEGHTNYVYQVESAGSGGGEVLPY